MVSTASISLALFPTFAYSGSMTVSELIAILQSHDPAAIVVVPTYNDRADACNAHGLRLGGVRTVNLREIHFNASWFDPEHGAQLYEIDDDGEQSGVEIG